MNNIRFLFFTLTLLFVAGCDVSNHVDKAMEQVDKAAEKTTNALARIQAGDLSDLDGFRLQVRTVKTSLATNDFP
jgi:hypothetical protein